MQKFEQGTKDFMKFAFSLLKTFHIFANSSRIWAI